MGLNPVQAWIVFQALISQLLQLCITAMINQVFIFLSAVRIYDLSHIHLHNQNISLKQKPIINRDQGHAIRIKIYDLLKFKMGFGKTLFVSH